MATLLPLSTTLCASCQDVESKIEMKIGRPEGGCRCVCRPIQPVARSPPIRFLTWVVFREHFAPQSICNLFRHLIILLSTLGFVCSLMLMVLEPTALSRTTSSDPCRDEKNDPISGFASLHHTANLSALPLCRIEGDL